MAAEAASQSRSSRQIRMLTLSRLADHAFRACQKWCMLGHSGVHTQTCKSLIHVRVAYTICRNYNNALLYKLYKYRPMYIALCTLLLSLCAEGYGLCKYIVLSRTKYLTRTHAYTRVRAHIHKHARTLGHMSVVVSILN